REIRQEVIFKVSFMELIRQGEAARSEHIRNQATQFGTFFALYALGRSQRTASQGKGAHNYQLSHSKLLVFVNYLLISSKSPHSACDLRLYRKRLTVGKRSPTGPRSSVNERSRYPTGKAAAHVRPQP